MTKDEAEEHYRICEPCCAAAGRPWLNHGRMERYEYGCRCGPCRQAFNCAARAQ